MTDEFDDATTRHSHPMGLVSLGFAIGAPVLGALLTWPSGNFVILFVVLFLGGVVAAMLGQFSVTDARNQGYERPISARIGRCLGWLELIAPLIVGILFYVALAVAFGW